MALALVALESGSALAVRVNPTGVNVRSQGATSVFLTFGALNNQAPAEGIWCGTLIPADPGIGLRCDPATIFGQLPARFDQSKLNSSVSFTDIMTIPPSVARRAFQDAQRGQPSSFFYVRRFQSRVGGPDEFVPVTCRLTAGGARVPFALIDVKIGFEGDTPVPAVRQGQTPPRVRADIRYNGTGRLKGRWEVVFPGESSPTASDLVTEASLPVEQRVSQRRFTQIERFNVFLPPTGRFTLPGPDPKRLPTGVEGAHQLLLRVEASDDKEADSDLGLAGAGTGIVHSGAVAGFPMPPLRYYVVGRDHETQADVALTEVRLLAPGEGASFAPGERVEFRWTGPASASVHRLEVTGQDGAPVLTAFNRGSAGSYRAPAGIEGKAAADGTLRWRVVALGARGALIGGSEWRVIRLVAVPADAQPKAAPRPAPGAQDAR